MDWDKVRNAVFAVMAQTEKDGLGSAWTCDEPGKLGRIRASSLAAMQGGLAPFCEGFARSEAMPFNGGPVIMHGRTATTPTGLANTHPFILRDKGKVWALAHNGVVESDKYSVRAGGCDSEAILEAFASGGMAEVAKHVDGYYAFLVLEKSQKRTLLHVIRDGMAGLFCGRIGEAWAFATTEEILRAAGATPVSQFKRHTHATFEGNKMISCKGFVQPVRAVTGYAGSTVGTYPKQPGRLGEAARKAFSGQQFALELEAQEEARLQAALQSYEERQSGGASRDPADFPMDERNSAHWPATLGTSQLHQGE